MTVSLTTQYLEEADHLASQIAVLDRGQIVAEGTPAQLKARIPGSHIRVVLADTTSLGGRSHSRAPRSTRINAHLRCPALVILIPYGRCSIGSPPGLAVTSLTVHTADLDDVFLRTGHHAASATQREQSLTMEGAR